MQTTPPRMLSAICTARSLRRIVVRACVLWELRLPEGPARRPPRPPSRPPCSPSVSAVHAARGRSTDAPAAMLPAALLRRPGLRRLLLQARTYAEAAAAPAPAAGPGQMSFTFASPTQVRTRSPWGRRAPDLTRGGGIHLYWTSSSNPTGTLSPGLAPSVGSSRARPLCVP